MSAAGLILTAWTIEVVFGWPKWAFKIIKHPVVWIGALISLLERVLNRTYFPHHLRYVCGLFTTGIVVSVVAILAWLIHQNLPATGFGFIVEAVIASSFIASRSLYQHVADVASPLMVGELDAARQAVSQIVGRDPEALDAAAMVRASLESLAENASDGVIAPLFYGVIFGLPGLAAYKAINTLDSMIGHRNVRYLAFGGFAARLDDVANFIPARLTGLLFSGASLRVAAFKTMFYEARKHRSVNAGWPESAMAGALDVRLSGPRQYGETLTQEPWLNTQAPDPCPADIYKGLRLYKTAMMGAAVCIMIMAITQIWAKG